MESLNSTKFKKIFEITKEAVYMQDRDLFRHNILNTVSETFLVDKGMFVLRDETMCRLDWMLRNIAEEKVAAYEVYFFKLDPFKVVSERCRDHQIVPGPHYEKGVVTLHEIVNRSFFLSSEYYNDFLRQQDIYYESVTYLKSNNKVIGWIGLFRPKGSKDFSKEESEIMKILAPYVTLALENIDLQRKIELSKHRRLNEENIGEVLCLSKRETEVVSHIFRGMRNSEIAEKLFISEISVKKHIQNICEKLGVNCRTAIIHKILESLNII